jgi:hypothetical protein
MKEPGLYVKEWNTIGMKMQIMTPFDKIVKMAETCLTVFIISQRENPFRRMSVVGSSYNCLKEWENTRRS